MAANDLERKSGAINLFGLDGDLRENVDDQFYHSNSTMVDECPPARGRSRPRRLGAPPARRDRVYRPPLRHCAARDASLEHVLRDDHACGSLRYQGGRGPRQVQQNRAHVRKPRRWPAPLRYEAFTVHCAGAGRTKPTLKIDSWSPSARGWLDRNGSWKRLSRRKTATFECPARCFFGHGDYRRRS